METRQFGKTDMQVTILGLGAAEMGFEAALSPQPTLAEAQRLLGSILDSGINVIDTAECYADSEALIGMATATRRNDFYLFTKCGHAGGEELPDLPDWDPRLLEASIERSLRRLRTDYIDLLQLHSCPLDILRQGEVVKVLEKAKRAGKTRYIGYSGDNEDVRYAIRMDVFDAIQTSINIADQQEIDFTLPMAIERNMGIIAKRPIADAAWISGNTSGGGGDRHAYSERLQRLQYDFLQRDPMTILNIALRFTLSVPGVHTAIVGTTDPAHWQPNVDAANQGPLLREQYESIHAHWEEAADQHWLGLV